MDNLHGPQTLASITFSTGPLAGKEYPLKKPVITLGRDPGNDIVIPEPSVSRHHASLVFQQGRWTISKVQQQNRLTINQRDMPEGQLQNRDTIGLGFGITFVFRLQPQQAPATGAEESMPTLAAEQPPLAARPAGAIIQASPVQPQAPRHGQAEAAFARPPAPAVDVHRSSAGPGPKAPQMQDGGGPGKEQETHDGGTVVVGIPTLEVSNNSNSAREVHKLNRPITTIGRAPNNDIVIDMPTVSGYHAQIVHEGNQFVFVHPHPSSRHTTNGLTYQGRKIAGNEPFRKTLARGDIFRISDDHGTYVSLTYKDGSNAAQEIVPDIRPIPLNAPTLTLGRVADNTVVLNHPQVSAHHARLDRVQNGYRIVDLNSTNHVYVNTGRVTNQQLSPGDEIRIGPFKLTYTGTQLTQHDESGSIRIDALHLKREGNKHVVLINDISLAIPPRKFVAVVGGSGAGKSTLMNALNGLRPADQGKVLYNGQDYYSHLAAFSTQLGYVPQDDIIHRDLTVERALYFAARLRLPDDFTHKQIKQRIDEVLDDVEMKSKRSSLVSKLSGGQRKRVSIALELLANPSVFFLDEPTSGLDPGLDRKMMLLLRKLADKGHTVVLVTHATNNINNCDYVCFLCQGGRLAYYGPPDGAKAYFGKEDFAEIYSALEPTEEKKDIPAQAEERFKQSEDYRRYVSEPLQQGPTGRANQANSTGPTAAIKPAKRGNPWKQFRILSMRYLTLLLNDRVNLAILILQAPIIAAFLFILTSPGSFASTSIAVCSRAPGKNCQFVVDQLKATNPPNADQTLDQSIDPGSGFDAQKTLLFMGFSVVLLGCLNGVREIVKEEAIYRRERAVNLGIVPYMFSKIVIQGLLALVQCGLIVLIVNASSPFVNSILFPPLIEIYITLSLTALAGLMLGLTISAISPNADRAMSFVPLILVPEILFSGAIFTLNTPLFQFISWFFAVHWGMAGMGSTVGLLSDKLATGGGGDNFIYQGILFTTVNGDPFPGAVFHLFLVWGVLIAMSIALGFATAYFLKKKDIRK